MTGERDYSIGSTGLADGRSIITVGVFFFFLTSQISPRISLRRRRMKIGRNTRIESSSGTFIHPFALQTCSRVSIEGNALRRIGI